MQLPDQLPHCLQHVFGSLHELFIVLQHLLYLVTLCHWKTRWWREGKRKSCSPIHTRNHYKTSDITCSTLNSKITGYLQNRVVLVCLALRWEPDAVCLSRLPSEWSLLCCCDWVRLASLSCSSRLDTLARSAPTQASCCCLLFSKAWRGERGHNTGGNRCTIYIYATNTKSWTGYGKRGLELYR